MLDPNSILQERYQIVRLIGQGGMGAVYEALDMRLGNTVALKQTLAPGGELGRAFEREARLLAGLRHPSLPKVIDHFVDASGQYLVMEFIAGDDLATQLERRDAPFPVDEVLAWADQLLRALEYLHARRPPILHRDIKPQNLKLTAEGEVVLLDFGLAKGDPGAQSQAMTGGSVFGYTPHYAPLEQIHNSGTDQRSDLYAVAATLHHLLTGVQPADALTRATAILRRGPDPLQSPTDINPRVPPEVSQVLMRALALNQDERPATAAEMRALLTAIREAAVPSEWDAPTVAAASYVEPVARPPSQPAQRPPDLKLPDLKLPDLKLRDLRLPDLKLRDLKLQDLRLPEAVRQRPRLAAGAAAGVLLVLLALLLRPSPGARGSAAAPTAAPTEPTVTETIRIRNTAPTARPAATTAPGDQSAAAPRASLVTPDSVYTGALPVRLIVQGERLDAVRSFELQTAGGASVTASVERASATEAELVIDAAPQLRVREDAFSLYLDGAAQPVTVTLRDYRERLTIRGTLAEHGHTGRVLTDASGAYTQMLADPAAGSAPAAVLRNGDEVDLLRDDVDGWYQVRLVIQGELTQASVVGWIERWLVDNAGVPPPPVFAGQLGKTPTDGAVRCGAQFRSSIYGSVERADGSPIGGASVRVTSADGKNSYTQRTRSNGTYTVGGLGCTSWVVELLSVPGMPGFDSNSVTVRNLNGGQYTAAEVRFRLQP